MNGKRFVVLFARQSGVSMVELFIGIFIFSILLAMVYGVFREVFGQGLKQDQKLTAWQTYCRFSEYLRNDMNCAFEAKILSKDEVEIKTVQIDSDFRRITCPVVYRQEGKTTILRIQGENKTRFEFAERGANIVLSFASMP